jgi:phosphoglycerate kinase
MISLNKIQDASFGGKKVFLRSDVDVPLNGAKIADANRLEAWLPTLKFLLENDAQVIIAGHLGRPEKEKEELSLLPIANWIGDRFDLHIRDSRMGDFRAWGIGERILLLENLRFYEGEEKNDPAFAAMLSSFADIYVNDAFASSHRVHASITGIPKIIPGYAGLRLQKEIEELSIVLENPARPLTIIVGGAKIETKLPLISKMHKLADFVLVGGEIAEHVKELAKVEHEKSKNKKSELVIADLTSDSKDINEESIQKFKEIVNKSKTVVWNGPMGEFEKCFDLGTREIASSIIKTNIHTIVGGGDTVNFLSKEGLLGKFSFVSTGGGAMLEFLSGEELPGLKVLSA